MIDVGRARPRAAGRSRSGSTRSPASSGIAIDRREVERILQALGLESLGRVRRRRSTFRPPSWRSDLEREIDLIEEVARIHGYEHIPEDRPCRSRAPRGAIASGSRRRSATLLTGSGFDEAVTFSLVADDAGRAARARARPSPPIRVEHSSRRRENALRQSLVPSLLAARRHNEAHGNPDAELFEIANVYLPRAGAPLPDEPTRLALVTGRDFRGLKGVVEALLVAAPRRRAADGPAGRISPLRPRPGGRAAGRRRPPRATSARSTPASSNGLRAPRRLPGGRAGSERPARPGPAGPPAPAAAAVPGRRPRPLAGRRPVARLGRPRGRRRRRGRPGRVGADRLPRHLPGRATSPTTSRAFTSA